MRSEEKIRDWLRIIDWQNQVWMWELGWKTKKLDRTKPEYVEQLKSHQSVHPSVHPSIHSPLHQSIHSAFHPLTWLSIYSSIHSSHHPSVWFTVGAFPQFFTNFSGPWVLQTIFVIWVPKTFSSLHLSPSILKEIVWRLPIVYMKLQPVIAELQLDVLRSPQPGQFIKRGWSRTCALKCWQQSSP